MENNVGLGAELQLPKRHADGSRSTERNGPSGINGSTHPHGPAHGTHPKAAVHGNGSADVHNSPHVNVSTNVNGTARGNGSIHFNGSVHRNGSIHPDDSIHDKDSIHLNGTSYIIGPNHLDGSAHVNNWPQVNGKAHTNCSHGHVLAEVTSHGANRDGSSHDQNSLEPIAIVGMAFKFPQDATSTESFWEMLLEKRCASTEFPKDRMNIDAFYDPDPQRLNRISTRSGHFLKDDVRAFDAPFFSIPTAEASTMDPQHRGLMEVTYHALENAGISMEKIAGSNTSVHVGCFTADFLTMNWRDSQQIPKYSATGTAASILSNRVSWFYDLTGPSMTVDTACSSGMIALDLACNGLWSGTSNMAIVAGANLICSPELSIALSNMNFLSPDGRCFSFDHRANGYARGEGFGVLVLKTVSQAVKDGDTIRALIRSVGTNQDGHTNGGITQPSKDLQAQLIAETYRKAGLDMSLTRFFEAHGTGTPIGDPIEARAVGESFRVHRSPTEPLYIGAVKSNLGHLEGASGLAGIIKTVLVLENGLIPPNANFENLNPNIDAEFFNIKFPANCIPWPGQGVRRASVNSFGFGGSNAHVILDDAHHYLQSRNLPGNHCTMNTTKSSNVAESNRPKSLHGSTETNGVNLDAASPKLLILSAADEGGISRLVEAYSQFFAKSNEVPTPEFLQNLALTLNTRRSLLPWKSYAVVSPSTLKDIKSAVTKPVRSASTLRLGFVFTGQGAQWYAMGRELLSCATFMESLRRSETYLYALGCEWSLIDELKKDQRTTRVGEPEFSQTLSTAIQVALVDLFEWLGVEPSVVVGHSSGEIAAAYCAGFLSHSSAIKVAYFRGVLASKLAYSTSQKKTMASVGLSQSQALTEMRELEQVLEQSFDAGQMTVSCINSPKNVTVSGPEHEVDIFIAHLSKREIFARKLKVNVAYHSNQMQEVAFEYLNWLQYLEQGSKHTETRMMSSVTCEIVSAGKVCTGEYWVQNLVSPVNFLEAMRLCCFRSSTDNIVKKLDRSHLNEIVSHFWVEVGPHSALQGPIRDILKSVQRSNEVTYSSALVRNNSAIATVLETVGRLLCRNYAVNRGRINMLGSTSAYRPNVLANLPKYPFNHSLVYWEESSTNKSFRFRQHAPNALLGAQVAPWNPLQAQWRFIIKADELPWVQDHKINGSILYPAAGMLTMAIEASKLLAEGRSPVGYEIKNAEFPAPILVPTGSERVEVHITLTPVPGSSSEHSFQIVVYKSDKDVEKVGHGSVRADYGRRVSEVDGGRETEHSLNRLRYLHDRTAASCVGGVEPQKMYKQLQDIGLDYGPSFQPLEQIRFNDSGEAIAAIVPFTWSDRVPLESNLAQRHVIHPSTFDGFFQLAFVALSKGCSLPLRTMVPTRIGRAWVSTLGAGNSTINLQTAHVQTEMISQRVAQCSISVLDERDRQPRVTVQELELTAISSSQVDLQSLQDPKHLCYHMDWRVDFDMLDVDQVQSYCEKARKPEPDPIEWFKDIEILALSFAAQALKELKTLNREPVPTLASYAAWLQSQLDRDLAELPIERALSRKELLYDKNHLNALCDRMAGNSKRGELYTKVGLDLTKMLLGEVDPLQLLFSDEQLLADFYEEVNTSPTAFDAITSYLDVIVHKDPGMKFLEIGAGTGATTTTILKTLAANDSYRYEQYVFTDISPSFFGKAQERFATQRRISYHVLNIEENPMTQGFGEAEYDILIATMVLHATKNLDVTLGNARKLLKPGGKLIFMEMTVPNITRTGFAFGLLPGWWLSSEDYRQQSPCITEDKWDEVLRRCNFSGTELVFKDYKAKECRGWSIMVSTATAEAPVLPQAPKATLLFDNRAPSQQTIVEELSRQFEVVGGSTDMFAIEEAASLKDINERHFILLGDLERPMLRSLNPETFSALQTLLASAGSLLWVTGGGGISPSSPDYGMVHGLCRVSRQENQAVPLVTLALETRSDACSTKDAANVVKVWNRIALGLKSEDFEPEYAEIEGLLSINRMIEANYLNDHVFARTARPVRMQEFGAGPPLKLSVRVPGLLDSLEFVDDESVQEPLAPEELLIKVHATGLNFKDCLTVLGRVNSDVLGCDCAGTVIRVGKSCKEFQPGDRVLGCVLNTYRTFARADTRQVAKIPSNMTFTEAASIPTAFSTAYYSLCEVARLQKGETILIHAASGGTGQAAVQVALDIGAEIFAAVGSLNKKQLLMDIYHIPDDHIFYSRDTSFADGVMRMTGGKGVDVVLNSLSGDGLVASWECIAPFGRFIEIGRKDIDTHGYLPMYPFIKNASFSGVDLAAITDKGALSRKVLDGMMDMIHSGRARLTHPLHVYPLEEIEQAFRFLQSGKSSGKIVLDLKEDALVPTVLGSKSNFSLDGNATYVVAGGLGGIGRNISRWLVHRGAKNLLLLSRSGTDGNEMAQALLADLHAKGAKVECPRCDIADMQSLKNTLEQCSQTMPPIKGCFQASMVLRDATFTGMSFSDWEESTRPKVQGSWNLHAALPSGMDFFIMLSSVCGVFGNAGQTNYAAGNTFQDALAEYRISRGEKAVALDLGVILSEGFVAENQHVMDRLMRLGLFLPIEQNELLAMFDYYCNPSVKPRALQGQVITGLELPANMLAKGSEIPIAMRQPLFRHMYQIASSTASKAVEQALDIKTMFMEASSLVDAGMVVAEGLKMKLSRMLGIPHSDIDLQHRVESYGVDSLVAVELRNWLARELGADVAVFEILGGATLVGVGHTVATKSSYRQSSWDEK